MKKTLLILALSLMAFSFKGIAQNDKKTESGDGPVLQLSETAFNFGQVEEGPDYTHVFKVKNVGKAPLVINSVQSPCGCTAPSFTKEPIAPGKSGEITVVYHSSGRIGSFNKTLPITTNMGDTKDMYINISGEVKLKGEIKKEPVKDEKKTDDKNIKH